MNPADSRPRLKVLLGHLQTPLAEMLDNKAAEVGYDKDNAPRGLKLVVDSDVWEKRTEIGIVSEQDGKGVTIRIDPNRDLNHVPSGYLAKLFNGSTSGSAVKLLSHMQFLMKKDLLSQDSFLLGPPGAYKRRIAMAYCELAGREVEFLSISQDTTVADIKQRREIKSGTARFEDSCAVRAAVMGRVLILEGVEKAERNVLSTLNNLLENREMSLEDGRFLTNPARFDSMMRDHGKQVLDKRWQDDDVRLVRVSDKFRVICLGVPVPEFEGNPLDPPFRSRFQSRDVSDEDCGKIADEAALVSRIHHAKHSMDAASVVSLDGVSTRALKRNSLPAEFNRFVVTLTKLFPDILGRFAIACVYPQPHLPTTDPTHRHLMMEALERHGLLDDPVEGPFQEKRSETNRNNNRPERDDAPVVNELAASTPRTEYRDRVLGPRFTSRMGYRLESANEKETSKMLVSFKSTNGNTLTLEIPRGTHMVDASSFVADVPYHSELLTQMVALYAVASHRTEVEGGTMLFSMVGPRGSGKTSLIKEFASKLGLNLVFFPLHRDMTSQDLFMRRATLANGDTVWHPSPLLTACMNGDLLVLDSVEAMAPATLGTLCSLLTDREASLPDGTRIVASALRRTQPGDTVAHPNFRVVAVGRPAAADTAGRARPAWLTSEVVTCFLPFIWVRSLTDQEERQVIETLLPAAKQIEDVQRLLTLGQHLRSRDDEESRALSLSTRQLIRISKRICVVHKEGRSELAGLVQHSCLWRFLPPVAKTTLENAMAFCKIQAEIDDYYMENVKLPAPKLVRFAKPIARRDGGGRMVVGELQIGDVKCDVLQPRNDLEKSLIPDTYFIDNPRQTRILKEMLQDYLLGSHLLLLGNQGTGKNKLVDHLLHMLNLPREYIQLDRDTTVNALTSQPVVQDGVVRYEDSPLVKAARFGRVLVVDEADKAPTHVTAILKSLLADGEMLLSDGRRLVSAASVSSVKTTNGGLLDSKEEVIPVHPDFRAIVLANRPGYPFLGNDLYRETGDIFAPHVVDNPDEESELALLREYAPNVPEETLRKLTVAFQDLRGLVNDGKLLYPYSTRELVNAVKHMEKFPSDGLAVTLQNVFDFDRYAVDDRKTISLLFERHGIPVALDARYKVKTGDVTPLPDPVLTETWKPSPQPSGLPASTKLNLVIHSIPWKQAQSVDTKGTVAFDMFPLTLIASKVPLVRHEGRATVFEEQLFSFSLPTAEFSGHGVGIVGACMLNDGSLVAAANDAYNALRMYWVKPPASLREFDIFDVAIPHFNFRDEYIPQVRRPAPSRCTIFPIPGHEGRVGLFSHDDQTLFLMDLINKHFRMFAIDPAVFRIQQPPGTAPPGLYAERMRTILCSELCAEFGVLVVYQQLSRVVLLYDLVAESRTTLVLPFPVDTLDSASPLSFLIRSATTPPKAYVLRATGEVSAKQSDSTALVIAGTIRSSIVYTGFTVSPVDQHRIDLSAGPEGEPAPSASNGTPYALHGLYSFFSPLPVMSTTASSTMDLKLSSGAALEKRFLRAPGTVCQVLEGFTQVFPPQGVRAVDAVSPPLAPEAFLRSYLRTSLSRAGADSVVACSPLYLRGTRSMASLALKRKKITSNTVGRLQIPSGYLGFDNSAMMEVVDLGRGSLRTIKVSLPDTNRRSGSAVLSEKFDPDNPSNKDGEEPDEDVAEDEVELQSLDEASSALRQRAPLVFMFQTVQGDVLTLDRTGVGRVFQVDQERLDKALESWKSMVGEKAGKDDIDFEDGSDDDDEVGDDDEDTDSEANDEDDEDDDDDNGDDDGIDEADQDEGEEGDDIDGEPQKGGKSRPGKGKGKAKKGGKAKGKGKGKGGRSKGGKGKVAPGSRRGGGRQGGRPSRGSNRGRQGQGNGQGSGQGGGGGSGSGQGGGEGDPMSLPEPGQFRGPRGLSARDKEIAQARLEELRRLTRYFPDDERIRGEMESLEERLEEAEEAERVARDELGDEATRDRLNKLRQRLGKLEAEIQSGKSEGRNTARTEAEAQQVRQMIDRLEGQLGGKGGVGEEGEDGQGENGQGGRGRGKDKQKSGKADEMEDKARKQARKMEKEAWKDMVGALESNPQDIALYQRYKDSVASEIRELRATLEQMQAKKNERVWLRNKDVGDLDDRRLVDGLTGERNIYKRRGDRPPDPFAFQEHPKRLTFLFDVSSSMSRYSMDGRLERSLEAATMAMEAFKGYEHKFAWKFRGHSGSTDDVTFVETGKYPKDDGSRLNVLRKMNAHAETCGSGDNTLDATRLAIREVTKDEGDEYFCILFSDANIEQYSIKPSDLKGLLEMDERVNVFIVFIGTMGQQAQRLRAELPQDKVFVTLSTSQIPSVLKRIFLSSVLKE